MSGLYVTGIKRGQSVRPFDRLRICASLESAAAAMADLRMLIIDSVVPAASGRAVADLWRVSK
jgi:hypothetical protein